MDGGINFVNCEIVKSSRVLERLLDEMIKKLEAILVMRSMGNDPHFNDQGRAEEGVKRMLKDLIKLEGVSRKVVNRISNLTGMRATMSGRVRRSSRLN